MKKNYLRMLGKLKAKGPSDWGVYIVRCGDGTLYTGTTNDFGERVRKHNSGKGAAYTRTRRPVGLVYCESGLTRSEALVREAAIKSMSRPKKEGLVLDPVGGRLTRL